MIGNIIEHAEDLTTQQAGAMFLSRKEGGRGGGRVESWRGGEAGGTDPRHRSGPKKETRKRKEKRQTCAMGSDQKRDRRKRKEKRQTRAVGSAPKRGSGRENSDDVKKAQDREDHLEKAKYKRRRKGRRKEEE